ncbi:MAG: rhodanese-like domain-containing protein [Halopseudomonas sp.]
MRFISWSVLLLSLLISNLTFAESREAVAWKMIDEEALLIDVRTDQEYVDGHLVDAILIPYQRIVDQFARLEIRKDRRVVLYCRSGRRAGIAETALRRAGYTNLFNGGGYPALIGYKRQQ